MYTKVLEEKCIQNVLNLRNPLLFVGHLFYTNNYKRTEVTEISRCAM